MHLWLSVVVIGSRQERKEKVRGAKLIHTKTADPSSIVSEPRIAKVDSSSYKWHAKHFNPNLIIEIASDGATGTYFIQFYCQGIKMNENDDSWSVRCATYDTLSANEGIY